MKLIGESVIVRCQNAQGCNVKEESPASVIWRGRLYGVQGILARWRWRGAWWTTPALKGRERIYYRVQCSTTRGMPAVMELYRERGRWMLSRLLD